MKKLAKILILFLSILLSGCATGQYTERVLTKTKAYCGQLVDIRYDVEGKISTIQTTMIIIRVKGDPDVPKGAHCYIRREICYQDVTESIKQRLEHKYFSWSNGSKEYRVKGNVPYRLFDIKVEVKE